jgi:glycosyltransferase involved in cell wall biosynthesis
VIPLYNKAPYIARALDSVFRQTVSDYEVVVIDDGSTDDGAEVVKGCSDPRLRLESQRNSGPASARNHGVELAAAGLVAFLDADDEWYPDFLATVLGLRVRFPEAGIYATAFESLDSSHTRSRPAFKHVPEGEGGLINNYFRSSLGHPPVWSSALMIPKRVYVEAGGSPVNVRYGEDLDTWMRIALAYPVAWSPKACAVYHTEVENRLCHKLWIGDVPFARSYEQYALGHPVADDVREAIEDYLAASRLTHLIPNAVLAGHKHLARELLGRTKRSYGLTKRWWIWRTATYLPHPLIPAMWRIWHGLSGRQVFLGPIASVIREDNSASNEEQDL